LLKEIKMSSILTTTKTAISPTDNVFTINPTDRRNIVYFDNEYYGELFINTFENC
jgi:hypothetical protein